MTSVLHLVGSPTDEFHLGLSRLYARGCLEATADPARYDVHVALVTPDGRWRFPSGLDDAEVAAAPGVPLSEAVGAIDALGVDVMVPHLFCRAGMTTYRGLFDVLGIPYVGSPPEVMANAADKPVAKAIVAAAGVRVPEGRVLTPGQRPTISPPAVVKPAGSDNSLGVSLVRSEDAWDEALAACFDVADRALVERYVELGREVRCGVLERDGELVALPLEEYAVDSRDRPVRGYADKLAADGSGLRLTAKDPSVAWIVVDEDPVVPAVQEAARRAHRALGCRHYGLFDFRIDPDGAPWFLEAGPYCSFAPSSVVATMARAAGTALPDLFAAMVDRAVADTYVPVPGAPQEDAWT